MENWSGVSCNRKQQEETPDKEDEDSGLKPPPVKKHCVDLSNLKTSLINKIKYQDLDILNEVRKGAFGTVCRARWAELDVAVKSIAVGRVKQSTIVKEIMVLHKITHNNVVSIKGYCYHNEFFHIVMEFVHGVDLKSLLHKEFYRSMLPLDPLDKFSIMKQLVSAVKYLHTHENQFLHRDIKPANIIITFEKKIAKLCDLGMVKIKEQVDSLLQTVEGGPLQRYGTYPFMAPEIFGLLSPYTEAADMWSLGITFIELFRGVCAYDIPYEDVQAEIAQIFKFERTPSLKGVPNIIKPLLNRCLYYNPLERITAVEFMSELEIEGLV